MSPGVDWGKIDDKSRHDAVVEHFDEFLASADADYISGQTLVVDGALELDFGELVAGLYTT